jgi:hypothetical protein
VSKQYDDLFGFGRTLLNRLDRIIELLETQGRVVVLPATTSTSDLPPRTARTPQMPSAGPKPKKSHGGHRIADDTYYRYVLKMVHMLLEGGNARSVGKLTTTLYRDLDMKPTTFKAMLERLGTEVRFVLVSPRPRGQAPFVKIEDHAAAEEWLRETEARLAVNPPKHIVSNGLNPE